MSRNRLATLFLKELAAVRLWALIVAAANVGLLAWAGWSSKSLEELHLYGLLISTGSFFFLGVVLGGQQGRELSGATRRHLLTFPVRPGELLLAKACAAATAVAAVLVVHLTARVGLAGWEAERPFLGVTLAQAFALSSLMWSVRMVESAMGRAGTWLLFVVGILYLWSFAFIGSTGLRWNVFDLFMVPLRELGRPASSIELAARWLGALLATGGWVLLGTSLTWTGIRYRAVS